MPAALEQAIMKFLAKESSARWRTAQELRDALQAVKAQGSSRGSGPQAAAKVTPSIAVLPFVNMSADADSQYFSDGLAEELINALTRLPGLNVASRTSAFRFRGRDVDIRDVGRQLNVDSVLEGSVRRAGPRLRVSAQLVKVADGHHVWAER